MTSYPSTEVPPPAYSSLPPSNIRPAGTVPATTNVSNVDLDPITEQPIPQQNTPQFEADSSPLTPPPPGSSNLCKRTSGKDYKPSYIIKPEPLPSPFQKAPKDKVTNFREGLAEGGRSAWAEVREGLKAPVNGAWDGVRKGNLLGAALGLVGGTAHLAITPITAGVAFLNHSSRGVIRGRRAAKEQAESISDGQSGYAPDYKPPSDPTASSPSSGSGTNGYPIEKSGNPRDYIGTSAAAGQDEGSGETSPLEMDTKWGGSGVEPARVPSRSQGEMSPQLELDTKWGGGNR